MSFFSTSHTFYTLWKHAHNSPTSTPWQGVPKHFSPSCCRETSRCTSTCSMAAPSPGPTLGKRHSAKTSPITTSTTLANQAAEHHAMSVYAQTMGQAAVAFATRPLQPTATPSKPRSPTRRHTRMFLAGCELHTQLTSAMHPSRGAFQAATSSARSGLHALQPTRS